MLDDYFAHNDGLEQDIAGCSVLELAVAAIDAGEGRRDACCGVRRNLELPMESS